MLVRVSSKILHNTRFERPRRLNSLHRRERAVKGIQKGVLGVKSRLDDRKAGAVMIQRTEQ